MVQTNYNNRLFVFTIHNVVRPSFVITKCIHETEPHELMNKRIYEESSVNTWKGAGSKTHSCGSVAAMSATGLLIAWRTTIILNQNA